MTSIRKFFLIIAASLFVGIAFTDKTTEIEGIRQKLLERKIGAEQIYELENLRQFYEKKPGGVNWTFKQAQEMLRAIEKAETRGLSSEDYHKKAIQTLLDSTSRNSMSPELDLLLSDSFLRLARHLAFGKTKPPSSWTLKRLNVVTADRLEQALHSADLSQVLYSAEPQSIQYKMLLESIHYYRSIAEKGGWEPIQERHKLSRGNYGEDVEALYRRLKITEEFHGEVEDPQLFDDGLEVAVRRFQETHGLLVDGIVGRLTREELNLPVEKRIRQLEVNLERVRWISENLAPRYIRINIPAYELSIIEQGHELLTMRIIAGKSDWPSPAFLNSEIIYLETNPFWNVPAVIAEKEIWPKVLSNPSYMAKNKLQRVKRADGTYMFRQQPGPHNSLGLIKIHFDNPFGCYLHDTPEKHLFEKSDRAFSHGCIRLENAFQLSAYLLLNDSNWDQNKLEEAAYNGVREKIYLADPIPILILYLTAWPDTSGTIQFRKDVYGADAALDIELKKNM